MAQPILDTSASPALPDVAAGTTSPAGISIAELVVDGSISDGDGAVEAIAITSVGFQHGAWEYSLDGGTTWQGFFFVPGNAVALDATARVRFVPSGTETAEVYFTFRAWDQSDGKASGSSIPVTSASLSGEWDTVSVTVTGSNTAPGFVLPDLPGVVSDSVAANTGSATVLARDDGSYVVVGGIRVGLQTPFDLTQDVRLVGFRPDGSLDTAFGDGGRVVQGMGPVADVAYDAALDGTGRILVAGRSGSSADDFLLTRFNADGSLDTSFGSGGIVLMPVGPSRDSASALLVQPDGKIIVGGHARTGSNNASTDFALVRYNEDGTLDTTFGGDGIVTSAVSGFADSVYSIALQYDGGIVAAGTIGQSSTTFQWGLARYHADGTLDTGFGNGGTVTTNIGSGDDTIRKVLVLGDGKILAVGYGWFPGDPNNIGYYAMARYNADGSLDTSFGNAGIVTTDAGPRGGWLFDAEVQDDGKIVAAGFVAAADGDIGEWDIAVVRYNVDGSLDTTFGDGGIAVLDLARDQFHGFSDEYAEDVTILPDGRIVVAGWSSNGGTYDTVLVRFNSDGTLDRAFGGPEAAYYAIGGSPVLLDAGVAVWDQQLGSEDASTGNYNGATLTLARVGGADSQDLFSAVAGGTLHPLEEGQPLTFADGVEAGTVTANSGGQLVITFNGEATQARVAELVTQIAYSNTATEHQAPVQIRWTFSDGNTGAQGTGGTLSAEHVSTVYSGSVFEGTPGYDELTGGAGDDLVIGHGAGDLLGGAAGNDTIDGGDGWDNLYGDAGDDVVHGGPGGDWIDGAEGSDDLSGDDGDDWLFGWTGSDTLDGGAGDDLLEGEGDDDALYGQGGDDELYGGDGNDLLDGGSGNDSLDGGEGNDTLQGGAGRDFMWVGAGDDSVSGGDGDDYMVVGGFAEGGSDSVYGGEGWDVVAYHFDGATDPVTFTSTLTSGVQVDPLGGTDTFDSIESMNIFGGSGNDSLTGGTEFNWLQGGAGDDTLTGGINGDTFSFRVGEDNGTDLIADLEVGDQIGFNASWQFTLWDVISGDDPGAVPQYTMVVGTPADGKTRVYVDTDGLGGADIQFDIASEVSAGAFVLRNEAFGAFLSYVPGQHIIGTPDPEYLLGGGGADTIEGLGGDDDLFGGAGNDAMYGGEGHDQLWAEDGDDSLYGGKGDDGLSGGEGNDLVDGGDGWDSVLYVFDNDTAGVSFWSTFADGEQWDFNGGYDTLVGIEVLSVFGGHGNDWIVGAEEVNVLGGNGGDDTLSGWGGNDNLQGGAGNDELYAGAGGDFIDGGVGDDYVWGDEGNDYIIAGGIYDGGSDTIWGGGGWDIAQYNYNGAPGPVEFISTWEDYAQVDPAGGTDWLYDIDSVHVFGSVFGDVIVGGAENNWLQGGGGNDTLTGGGSPDTFSFWLGEPDNGIDLVNDLGIDDEFAFNADGAQFALTGIVAGDDPSAVAPYTVMVATPAGGTTRIHVDTDGIAGADLAFDVAGDVFADQFTLRNDSFGAFLRYVPGQSIFGTEWADDLFGGGGADEIHGLEGNDWVSGGDANDLLYGEAGDDTLHGEFGDDSLYGGTGNDYLNGGKGADQLVGGDGDDYAYVSSRFEAVDAKWMDGGEGWDRVAYDFWGLPGPITFTSTLGQGTQVVGGRTDTLTGFESLDVYGSQGDDVLTGGAEPNWIAGNQGADTVAGGGGDDHLVAGGWEDGGSDSLSGGDGFDLLVYDYDGAEEPVTFTSTVQSGQQVDPWGGTDTFTAIEGLQVFGGWYADTITGGGETDWLHGNEGDDQLHGGSGNDRLFGGEGYDFLHGGKGDDLLDGGAYDDYIVAGGTDNGGDDTVVGGWGWDAVTYHYGSEVTPFSFTSTLAEGFQVEAFGGGTDILLEVESLHVFGGSGNDTLTGGDEQNWLQGGGGDDLLTGGDDIDTFGFYLGEANSGIDLIADVQRDDRFAFNLPPGQDPFALLGVVAGDDPDALAAYHVMVGTPANGVTRVWVETDGVTGADLAFDIQRAVPADAFSIWNDGYGSAMRFLGAEFIEGTDGDDWLYGSEGPDEILAYEGNDYVDAGAGNDSVSAGGGHDEVYGVDGDDTLRGDDGHDVLDGGAGNDLVDGGAGYDRIMAGAYWSLGDDTIIGGADWDVAIYDFYWASEPVTFTSTFASGTQTVAGLGTDTFQEVEVLEVSGSGYGDTITGGAEVNDLSGGSGNDQLAGGDGNDTLRGDWDDDVLDGGAGDDLIVAGGGHDVGDDTVIGGDGWDAVVYDYTSWGYDVTFSSSFGTGLQEDPWGGIDSLAGVEALEVWGGWGNDTFSGGDETNRLWGNDGNDDLFGGGGADSLYGGKGDDFIEGGTGNDLIAGGDGGDYINAGGTYDGGSDSIDGGDGFDIASYNFGGADAPVDFVATLGSGFQEDPAGGIDTLAGIESIHVFGGAFNDSLTGGSEHNWLEGGGGDDTLTGGGGSDIFSFFLDGVNGVDLITDFGYGDQFAFHHPGTFAVSGVVAGDAAGEVAPYQVMVGTPSGGLTRVYLDTDGVTGADLQFDVAGTLSAAGLIVENRDWGAVLTWQPNLLIEGTNDPDDLEGAQGHDTIFAYEGNDWALGRPGDDSIVGAGGNDTLFGEAGNDTLEGGSGNDQLDDGSGHDSIDGGAGDDYIAAGADDGGDDTFVGGEGSDVVSYYYGWATDPIYFESTLQWGFQWDLLDGLDTLVSIESLHVTGGAGNDTLVGGEEHNWLDGGAGSDQLWGGGGRDVFSFWLGAPNGTDLINDLQPNEQLAFSRQGLTFAISAVVSGDTAGDVGPYTVMVGTPAEGRTRIYVDTDGVTGADLQFDIDHEVAASEFVIENQGWGAFLRWVPDLLVEGTDGPDELHGGEGNDTILGFEGDDLAFGHQGDDSITGDGGDDDLFGEGGDDSLYGGKGNDFISAGAGDDHVSGGDGDDYMVVGGTYDVGSDSVDGGAGWDVVSYNYSGETAPVTFTSTMGVSGTQQDPLGGTDTLQGIESVHVFGGSGNDTLTGGTEHNWLVGNAGRDVLTGGDGGDTFAYSVYEDNGVDRITDLDAYDEFVFNDPGSQFGLQPGVLSGDNPDTLNGGHIMVGSTVDGITKVYVGTDGTPGADITIEVEGALSAADLVVSNNNIGASVRYLPGQTITGSEGNDNLNGSNNADTILGLGGDDWINGNGGNDSIDGGAGSDWAAFWTAGTEGTVADLSAQTPTAVGPNGTDTLAGIENLAGGMGNDTLIGDANGNSLRGEAGDDTIAGNGGHDFITGGSGNDLIDGGDGSDTADYYFTDQNGIGIEVDLGTGVVTGGQGNDTVQGIEHVWGSEAADTIVGDASNNALRGRGGNDSLVGGGGFDALIGGAGNDTLDGGAITDRTNFNDGNQTQFHDATTGVNVNLTGITGDGSTGSGTATDGLGGTDVLRNINTIVGTPFADTITGSGAGLFEQIEGGAGDDVLNGGAVSSTVISSELNRVSYGNAASAVTVNFTTGVATGGDGNDTISNFTQVRGSAHGDSLTGSDRTDFSESFEGRAGDDTIDGLGGIDIVRYDGAPSGVTVNLASGSASDGYGGTDSFSNIEGVFGGSGNDSLLGGNAANGVVHTDGLLEIFRGGAGNDTIDGGQGYDRADYTSSTAPVTVTLGGTSDGTAADGFGGTDILRNIEAVRGSDHNDTLQGSATGVYESFEGRTGNDSIDGGLGVDRADYVSSPGAVNVNLGAQVASDGWGGTDTLLGIEDVRGSREADTITGSSGANYLDGQGGNDTLQGGAGNDTLKGGDGSDWAYFGDSTGAVTINLVAGTATSQTTGTDSLSGIENVTGSNANDTITGDANHNTLRGENGNDSILGNEGNDYITGGAGNDTINGGDGNDTADYFFSNAAAAVNVNLSNGIVSGGQGNDRLSFVENVNATDFNDTILGSTAANFIEGRGGNDTITAGDGNDSMIGGAGNDSLLGQAGGDFFRPGTGNDAVNGDIVNDRVNYTDGNSVSYSEFSANITLNLSGITGTGSTGTGSVTSNDTTAGGTGNDTLSNVQFFTLGSGNDTVTGSSARIFEQFEPGAGNDSLDGGAMTDTLNYTDGNRLNYSSAGGSVVVDLAAGTATGAAGNDTFTNFNQVRGSQFADTLLGSNLANYPELYDGRGGNDWIDGRGGFDILRYDSATAGVYVHLVAGYAEDGLGGVDTLVGIEGVFGSPQGDTLVGGNAAAGIDVYDGGLEVFRGGAGNDWIDGGQGYDRADYNSSTLGVQVTLGGTGNGTASDGLGGTDTLVGIEGVRGSELGDTLTGSDDGEFENFEGRGGNDLIDGRGNWDRVDYYYATGGVDVDLAANTASGDASTGTDTLANIEGVRGSRDFNDSITGNAGVNYLEGMGGNDSIVAGAGNDVIEAGTGVDTVDGGADQDVLVMRGNFADYDFNRPNATQFNLTSAANGENVTFSGIEEVYFDDVTKTMAELLDNQLTQFDDIYVGDDNPDSIDGLGGNDNLSGAGGNDTIVGGPGNDSLYGGKGDDTFDVNAAGDVVVEQPGEGFDKVFVSATTAFVYTLPANVEQGYLTGSLGSGLVGNELDNHLSGNPGNNSISGAAGNDTLIGAGGNDTLVGGTGNDQYQVDSTTDVVNETLSGGGTDWVQVFLASGVTWTLPAEVEHAWVGDNSAGVNLTGNDLGNYLLGSDQANVLIGGNGNDTLEGFGGHDNLQGGAGFDFLLGGAGNDTMSGGPVADRVNFTDGNWISYYNSSSGIVMNLSGITGDGSVGTGTVQDGMGGVDVVSGFQFFSGSPHDDSITGSSADLFEQFEGGAGNDTIDGGTLVDSLYQIGSNRVSYAGAGSAVEVTLNDTGAGFASGGGGDDELYNITQVRGSNYDDTLTGSDRTGFSEQFEGAGGNDSITGNGGNDLLRYFTATSGISLNLETGIVQDGLGGVDTVSGIEGVLASPHADSLVGSGNDESFRGNAGNDTIDGGLGFDRADYLFAPAGVSVTLGGSGVGSASDGFGGTDELHNMEGVRGSDLNDTITGSNEGIESFDGRGGNDLINGMGGIDRADYTVSSAGVTVDLGLATATALGDASVGTDTLQGIEWVRGSADFNDVLRGNALDNRLEGQGGNDSMAGAVGNDSLWGGTGNDTADGGLGDDVLDGAEGNDSLLGGDGNDTVSSGTGVDFADGGLGSADVLVVAGERDDFNVTRLTDTDIQLVNAISGENVLMRGFESVDFNGNVLTLAQLLENSISPLSDSWVGTEGPDTVDGLAGNDTLDGLGDDDSLAGGAGNDSITGGWGNDTLDGGAGNDQLQGGEGDDTYVVDAAADVVNEADGEGIDQVNVAFAAAGTFSLATNAVSAENATVTSAAAINLTGNALDNMLTGNAVNNILLGNDGDDSLAGLAGNDTLNGGSGNDTLDGGVGNDSMLGGAGDDTYVLSAPQDIVNETLAGSDGTDTVVLAFTAAGAYTLLANVEHGVIESAVSGVNLTGNTLANSLQGGAGNNLVAGGDGNDTLAGGGGNDTLDGGTGTEDTAVLPEARDMYEVSRPGQAELLFTHTVTGATVRVLNTEFFEFEDGTRSFAELIVNTISPLDDVWEGTEGADTVDGLAGNDTLDGRGDDDSLAGGAGNDSITGGWGNDTLDGGAGTDRMIGGEGDDTYVVDAATDVVTEGVDEGTDQLNVAMTAAGTFNMATNAVNVENATVTSAAAVNITGNALDNVLTGNAVNNTLLGNDGDDSLAGLAGNDTLNGGVGNDTLDGGLGNDSMLGGAGDDTYVLSAQQDIVNETLAGSDGTDTVVLNFTAAGAYTLPVNVEQGVIESSVSGVNLTGNTLANSLHGGAGNNQVAGGDGNDTLAGGGGNDTLDGGVGAADTAIIPDALEMYAISRLGQTELLLTHGVSGETLRVLNTELFEFTDGTRTFADLIVNTISPLDDVWVGTEGPDTVDGLAGNDTLDGQGDDDSLAGGAGNDSITGGWGNDTLDGGTGTDRLAGGAGDDVYVVDVATDFVTEGVDEHFDHLNVALTVAGTFNMATNAVNVENATVTSAAAVNITGNALDNLLVGNAANNILLGNEGDDVLVGLAGNDTLNGGSGNDLLDGGVGNDSMLGGAGDDTYVLSAPQDLVNETVAGSTGTDTVLLGFTAAGAYTLTANVEDAIVIGTVAGINVTGNAGANRLEGGTAANLLAGGDGNDTLLGGGGNDTLDGGTGTEDVVVLPDARDMYDVSRPGQSELLLTHTLSGETLRVLNTEFFEFADGTASFGDLIVNTISPLNDVWVGTEGADTVDALAGNDILNGMSGDDALAGNLGNDSIEGGDGNDTLDGGAGVDTLQGGAGDDTYVVDVAGDVTDDLDGTDAVLVAFTAAGTFTLGQGIEQATVTSAATVAVGLAGNALDNLLTGNGAGNLMSGAAGNDTLDGGLGNDTLDGGAGADVYIANVGTDSINDTGSVTDRDLVLVRFTAGGTLTLNASIEDAQVDNATAGVNLTGNASANHLTGNALNNVLSGSGGDDTLVGAGGSDTVDGGLGADRVVLQDNFDQYEVTRNLTGAIVIDHVSTGEVVTATGVEVFEFADGDQTPGDVLNNIISGFDDYWTGSEGNDTVDGQAGNDTLNGLGGDDSLLGGAGNDSLNGGAGNDTLNGGTGSDTLAGGTGDDLYVVDALTDMVSEGEGEGADALGVALAATGVFNMATNAAGVEDAFVTSTAAVSITGNALDNTLTGNAVNNTLLGNEGNDSLSGLAGNDTLNGGLGDDTLDGGVGNDSMIGGVGNDTYVLTATTDAVNETVAGSTGTDTVLLNFTLAASYTLGVGVENAQVISTVSGINVNGNAVANLVVGNAGNNSFTGLAGDDTFAGGGGTDVVDGGNDSDTLVLSGVASDYAVSRPTTTQTVFTRNGAQVTTTNIELVQFDNETVTLASLIQTIGSTGNETLTGGADGDLLDGGAGNDTLAGNDGDDTLLGSAGNDSLVGGAGADWLDGGAGNDLYVFNAVEDGDDYIAQDDTLAASIDTVRIDTTAGGSVSYTRGDQSYDDLVITVTEGPEGAETVHRIVVQGFFANDAVAAGTVDRVTVTGSATDAGTKTAAEIAALAMVLGDGETVLVGVGTNDSLDGNAADNWILAGAGDDTVTGGDGADTLYGAAGNDVLAGGDWDDLLVGGAGNDQLAGGAGDDSLSGGAGNDTYVFTRGDGTDVISESLFALEPQQLESGIGPVYVVGDGDAPASRDTDTLTMQGLTQAEVHASRSGNDLTLTVIDTGEAVTVQGFFASGVSTIERIGFADATWTATTVRTKVLVPTADNDEITGYLGGERLNGLAGDDTLSGMGGNDTLNGGEGSDWLAGGAGSDRFVLANNDGSVDTIADYGSGDTVAISKAAFGLAAAGATGTRVAVDGTYIAYDQDTGELSVDADGAGAGEAIVIAVLGLGVPPALTEVLLVA